MRAIRLVLPTAILIAPTPARAIDVDGRIAPGEWEGARHVTDFRQIQPFSGAPASQPTEAWILATPEGLAVAFRNAQPSSVPRTGQKVRRDFTDQVDRVNLYVDFDGDGRAGYNFRVSSTNSIADLVITNENAFSSDWDGNWRHAVGDTDDGWSVEILIPWYIAPMRKVDGGTRKIGIAVDRVIGSTGERSAWPLVSFERARFLSDFAAIDVQAFDQPMLLVTPYVSALHTNRQGGETFDGGVAATRRTGWCGGRATWSAATMDTKAI